MPEQSGQAKVGVLQGATEIYVDLGGTLNCASGAMSLPPGLRRGLHNFDILSAREMSSGEALLDSSADTSGASNIGPGGLLHSGGDPKLVINSTANQAMGIQWASANVKAVRLPTFIKPQDFDNNSPITISVIGEISSAAGNNGVDIRVWDGFNTTEVGTTCAAFTSAPLEYSITVSATGLTSHPGFLNVQLVPGTHATGTLTVWACYLEYNRLSS